MLLLICTYFLLLLFMWFLLYITHVQSIKIHSCINAYITKFTLGYVHMCTMLWFVIYREQIHTYLFFICLCTQHVPVCCGLLYMHLLHVCVRPFLLWCSLIYVHISMFAVVYGCLCSRCIKLSGLLFVRYAWAHGLLISSLFKYLYICICYCCTSVYPG